VVNYSTFSYQIIRDQVAVKACWADIYKNSDIWRSTTKRKNLEGLQSAPSSCKFCFGWNKEPI